MIPMSFAIAFPAVKRYLGLPPHTEVRAVYKHLGGPHYGIEPRWRYKEYIVKYYEANREKIEASTPALKTVKEMDRKLIISPNFTQTREWKVLRVQAFKKYGTRCQCCGVTSESAVLNVDHVKPRVLFPELALDIDNLQILCSDCNTGKSNSLDLDFRSIP